MNSCRAWFCLSIVPYFPGTVPSHDGLERRNRGVLRKNLGAACPVRAILREYRPFLPFGPIIPGIFSHGIHGKARIPAFGRMIPAFCRRILPFGCSVLTCNRTIPPFGPIIPPFGCSVGTPTKQCLICNRRIRGFFFHELHEKHERIGIVWPEYRLFVLFVPFGCSVLTCNRTIPPFGPIIPAFGCSVLICNRRIRGFFFHELHEKHERIGIAWPEYRLFVLFVPFVEENPRSPLCVLRSKPGDASLRDAIMAFQASTPPWGSLTASAVRCTVGRGLRGPWRFVRA